MRKLIYKVAKRLYFKHLIPWTVWSPIYDHWHRLVED